VSLKADAASRGPATAVLVPLLKTAVEEGKWREIIDILGKQDYEDMPAVVEALQQDSLRERAIAALIRLFARSERLANERADRSYVSGFLERWGLKQSGAIREFVTAQEVGAAIERAYRIQDALRFYESVFIDKRWNADRWLDGHAKARWLRCKERQAQADPKRKEKSLREAADRVRDWGIPIPAEEYPVLDPIAPSDLEALLAPPSVSTVEENAAATPTAPEIKEPTSEPASQRFQPSLIPVRPAMDGHVDVTFALSGLVFELRSIPMKRRAEIRRRDNQDLVMVLAKERVVESRDTNVSNEGDQRWVLADWGLKVALLSVGDVDLVDLTTLDEKRVLCHTI
jgi:hypothetical protein